MTFERTKSLTINKAFSPTFWPAINAIINKVSQMVQSVANFNSQPVSLDRINLLRVVITYILRDTKVVSW